ncbi:MAG: murein biosynthesis integral membrane protein MurJ [Planctomycetes bacterium]|nr:murein biosynthesis integral membrane protein MurJ [Planctomycetota bacterium]
MAQHQYSVIRKAGLVSALTLLSRILGVFRDAACAAFFGAGLVWDAFSFAFRIPNMFRRLFGEGALSAAFVPALIESLERDPQKRSEALAARVTGALIAVLLALILLGELVVCFLLIVLRPSLQWHLALTLTALLLPYALLICLTALAGAMLESQGHFAAPALAPVILNLFWLAAVVAIAPAICPDPRRRVIIVAAVILIAGLAQLSLQLLMLRRKGFRWRPIFEPLHSDVRQVARSMAPVAIGLAAFQLNVLLDGVIAISLAGPKGAALHLPGLSVAYPMRIGANSVLYYGSRLMQLPLGVVGLAFARAVFPTLSAQAARGEWKGFSESVVRGLALMLFIGIPAGAGLIALRRPVIELIFQRGQFTPAMAARTARVLACYSTAIWAYCALHVLTRAFYSLKKPAVPARIAAAAVALNLALNLSLVWFLQESGLAIATAVCASLQVIALCLLLHRAAPLSGLASLPVTVVKTLASTALMVAAARGCLLLFAAQQPGLPLKLARATGPALAGAVAFFGAAWLLKSRELHILTGAFMKKNRKTPPK